MPAQKFSIRITNFRPYHAATLRGFVDILIPELHLHIADLTVHEHALGARWAHFPGRPILGGDGAMQRDSRGKVIYTNLLRFNDPETSRAFSSLVIAGLLEFAPDAFGPQQGALHYGN